MEKALQNDIKNPNNYRDILTYISTAMLTVITSFSLIAEKAHKGLSQTMLSLVYGEIEKMLSKRDEKIGKKNPYRF